VSAFDGCHPRCCGWGGRWGSCAFQDLCNLDESVGGGGAVCEGRDVRRWFGLEEGEHVVGSLLQVVCVGDLGEWDDRWEPFDGEGVADTGSAGDGTLEAVVVFG
jgi:hypothetical protein